MTKTILFIFPVLFFACVSKDVKHRYSSFELTETGDTINREYDGIKQGQWLILDSNELRKGNRKVMDTIYYKDNKVIDNK